MIVLVCGGRSFHNYAAVEKWLDMLNAIHKFSLVIHGNAPGADFQADVWAHKRHIDVRRFPADWERYRRPSGKNPAGAFSNGQMLREGKPQLVIAFPGGSGTADMKRQAGTHNVPVIDLMHQDVRDKVVTQYKALKDGIAQAAR